MSSRFEQKIEQLESIVEKCLGLCQVTRNGFRCTLPANHQPAEPHKFPIELPGPSDALAHTRDLDGQTPIDRTKYF